MEGRNNLRKRKGKEEGGKERGREQTGLFQFLLCSVVESHLTIQHPVLHITSVNLTKS